MSNMSRKRSRLNFAQNIILTSAFDHEILDCPICMEPLAPPIHQCVNGHISCATCRPSLKDVCPSCSKPVGYIRNLILEKLIESLKTKCKFWEHGCLEVVKFTERSVHENQCHYIPVKCPVHSCEFIGPEMEYLRHFEVDHQMKRMEFFYGKPFTIDMVPSSGNFYYLLKAGDALFLLHLEEVPLGFLFYVTRFSGCAPNSNRKVFYELELKTYNEQLSWETTHRLESICCFSTIKSPAKSFLVLPYGPQKVNVKLLIKEVDKPTP